MIGTDSCTATGIGALAHLILSATDLGLAGIDTIAAAHLLLIGSAMALRSGTRGTGKARVTMITTDTTRMALLMTDMAHLVHKDHLPPASMVIMMRTTMGPPAEGITMVLLEGRAIMTVITGGLMQRAMVLTGDLPGMIDTPPMSMPGMGLTSILGSPLPPHLPVARSRPQSPAAVWQAHPQSMRTVSRWSAARRCRAARRSCQTALLSPAGGPRLEAPFRDQTGGQRQESRR